MSSSQTFLILILVIGGSILLSALYSFVQAVRGAGSEPRGKAALKLVSSFLLIYGIVGFFGAAASAAGGLRWVPPTVELPFGWVSGAVRDREGNLYCPSTPFGRIQAYDSDFRFLRGWFVEGLGGVFRIRMNDQDQLEVVTARGNRLYVFEKSGDLVSKATYEPKSYDDFKHWEGERVVVPTPAPLWPMSHPFGSWAMAALGMLGLALPALKRTTPEATNAH